MSIETLDKETLDAYAADARASWGDTPAYREFEEKAKGRSDKENLELADRMMGIFREFGEIKGADPASSEAQAMVKKLQDFITGHYYTCTKEILSGLGQMYAAGGEFTANIDKAGGAGTAGFAAAAIACYCR